MQIQIMISGAHYKAIKRLCKKKGITRPMFFRRAIDNHIQKLKSEKGFFGVVKEKPKKAEPFADAFALDELPQKPEVYSNKASPPFLGNPPAVLLPKCQQCGVELTPGNVDCKACGFFNI